jgi:hypothetical protein
MPQPKWATSNRQAHLVRLFLQSGGFCVYGHKPCSNPAHHYELYIEGIIKDWVADDRGQSQALWETERKALHSLGERRYPLRGQFSAIAKDIFYPEQPSHYLEGLGISGLTFKPFAKVRVSSSYMRLFVDLGDTLKDVPKVKRRKAIRYGKALPPEAQRRIEQAVSQAVKHYLSNR